MKKGIGGRRIAVSVLFLLLALCFFGAATFGALYLWADTLYRDLLDGRKAPPQQASPSVTSFDLFAEENRHQTGSRISGWLSYVSAQETSINVPWGTLKATQFDPLSGASNAPWAIVLHGGPGTDYQQVLDVACELSLAGYRVLTPDLFAHGRSDGAASGLGFGDARDVHAWIGYIEKTQMDASIVLFGQDEGAAAVLMAACEGLSGSVAAAAADSVSDDAIGRLLSLSGAEDGGIRQTLLEAAFRLRTGFTGEKLSGRIAAADIPLLLIHGTGDQDVPAWQSEDIALAAGENAQLLYIEGAGHGLSRYVEPQTYYDALLGFFDRALNN